MVLVWWCGGVLAWWRGGVVVRWRGGGRGVVVHVVVLVAMLVVAMYGGDVW